VVAVTADGSIWALMIAEPIRHSKLNSMNHQNSERLARPLNVTYFLKEVWIAEIKPILSPYSILALRSYRDCSHLACGNGHVAVRYANMWPWRFCRQWRSGVERLRYADHCHILSHLQPQLCCLDSRIIDG